MALHHGSCHCGAVKIEVEGDFKEGMECNCSHCHKKGFLLAFAPRSAVRVVSGEGSQTEYRFNTGKIAHLFCPTCGVQVYSEGEGPGGAAMSAVNLRALDDLDIETLEIRKINGKDF